MQVKLRANQRKRMEEWKDREVKNMNNKEIINLASIIGYMYDYILYPGAGTYLSLVFDYDNEHSKKNDIYIKSKITNITEDMFSYIITLVPYNSENQITWRLDKDKYKNDYELGKEINLSFNTDDIIFLK